MLQLDTAYSFFNLREYTPIWNIQPQLNKMQKQQSAFKLRKFVNSDSNALNQSTETHFPFM